MGGLGITAMNQGITNICYGITLKYLGITHNFNRTYLSRKE